MKYIYIKRSANYLQFLQEFLEILVFRRHREGRIYQVVLFRLCLRMVQLVPICNKNMEQLCHKLQPIFNIKEYIWYCMLGNLKCLPWYHFLQVVPPGMSLCKVQDRVFEVLLLANKPTPKYYSNIQLDFRRKGNDINRTYFTKEL